VTGGRWELLRALGAVADSPEDARTAARALGLRPVDNAEHTEVFVLNCPPYASVYLGPDGARGGEGADRVAGFWRALGLTPPTEPDHLAALLGLYASLGEAAGEARRPATAAALARSGAVLFSEHLWPWLPAYLAAVTDVAGPSLAAWASLTGNAVTAEFTARPAPAQLPLALRAAAGQASLTRVSDLTGHLTTPVRSGIILTRRLLACAAAATGVGYRIGERRFALRAMLEQDPSATLAWLDRETRRWQARHTDQRPRDAVSQWWAARASWTARMLSNACVTARSRQAGGPTATHHGATAGHDEEAGRSGGAPGPPLEPLPGAEMMIVNRRDASACSPAGA
jgi:TorA maturation chaperone TorD